MARVPAAVNLVLGDLADSDIVFIANGSPLAAQTTLGILKAFFQYPAVTTIQVEDGGQTIDMDDFYATTLVVDSTVSGLTTVNLPTEPDDGEIREVKDGGGQLDIGVRTITVSGNGRNINGLSTLVMQAAWQFATFTYSEDLDLWLTT